MAKRAFGSWKFLIAALACAATVADSAPRERASLRHSPEGVDVVFPGAVAEDVTVGRRNRRRLEIEVAGQQEFQAERLPCRVRWIEGLEIERRGRGDEAVNVLVVEADRPLTAEVEQVSYGTIVHVALAPAAIREGSVRPATARTASRGASR